MENILNEVYIRIQGRIIVHHSIGFFQITKEELIKVIDDYGEIDYDKIKKLYNERYNPIHYAI